MHHDAMNMNSRVNIHVEYEHHVKTYKDKEID